MRIKPDSVRKSPLVGNMVIAGRGFTGLQHVGNSTISVRMSRSFGRQKEKAERFLGVFGRGPRDLEFPPGPNWDSESDLEMGGEVEPEEETGGLIRWEGRPGGL
jgi:hypothetical protein